MLDTKLIADFGLSEHPDALRSFMSETIDLISSSVPGLDHIGLEATTDTATLSIDDVSLLLIDGCLLYTSPSPRD